MGNKKVRRYPRMGAYEPADADEEDHNAAECVICKEPIQDARDVFRPLECNVSDHMAHRHCMRLYNPARKTCIVCNPLGEDSDGIPQQFAPSAVHIAVTTIVLVFVCISFAMHDKQDKALKTALNSLGQLQRHNQEGYRCARFDDNSSCKEWKRTYPNSEVTVVVPSTGFACWDLTMDGRCNHELEDRNNDGVCNTADCQARSTTATRTQATQAPQPDVPRRILEEHGSGISGCWDHNGNSNAPPEEEPPAPERVKIPIKDGDPTPSQSKADKLAEDVAGVSQAMQKVFDALTEMRSTIYKKEPLVTHFNKLFEEAAENIKQRERRRQ